ncbi:MAG: hypothetical protein EZS28_002613, partial [Streblomastix strix]
IEGRIIAGDGQEQREAAVALPQMKYILAGNSGLSNLISEEFIDRLQKAHKAAKAIRVVQNQQRIQLRPTFNHFAQVPRNIPMIIGMGMICITRMNAASQMNYMPAYNSKQVYGYVGNQQGVKQYLNLMSYAPNRGSRIRYNDHVSCVAVVPVVQPQNEEKEQEGDRVG